MAIQLCRNRKDFCDDGKPERYECGAKNQRCDRVTITIHCDADMRRLMTKGIGPNGTKIFEPNMAQKDICDLEETRECSEDDE